MKNSNDLLKEIIAAAEEKHAESPEIIDVRQKVDYTDYVIILSGRSDRQVKTIAEHIEDKLHKKKIVPVSVEGVNHSQWILIDYIDVVIHIFLDEIRQYYDIESLWLDTPRVDLNAIMSAKSKKIRSKAVVN